MKKKINRITENVFAEIHGIKEAMPGLTAKTVAEILTYEEYKRYNEARTGTGSAATQAKPMDGQTEIELQIAEEEKPRMSEAARTMIGNQERIIDQQERILDQLMALDAHIIQGVNILYDIAGKMEENEG